MQVNHLPIRNPTQNLPNVPHSAGSQVALASNVNSSIDAAMAATSPVTAAAASALNQAAQLPPVTSTENQNSASAALAAAASNAQAAATMATVSQHAMAEHMASSSLHHMHSLGQHGMTANAMAANGMTANGQSVGGHPGLSSISQTLAPIGSVQNQPGILNASNSLTGLAGGQAGVPQQQHGQQLGLLDHSHVKQELTQPGQLAALDPMALNNPYSYATYQQDVQSQQMEHQQLLQQTVAQHPATSLASIPAPHPNNVLDQQAQMAGLPGVADIQNTYGQTLTGQGIPPASQQNSTQAQSMPQPMQQDPNQQNQQNPFGSFSVNNLIQRNSINGKF